ncbi:unnamed protein product [Microthlaspi erraticum]|uniref:KIB1-4 beta-propeller domain-containing protein n=1 Tax=Microthlaspi erraticum TaxID=1685480 RepID=A0A6D2HNA7_9BRAS|nr:unnamed protein product [Microthlaspi erraticum]
METRKRENVETGDKRKSRVKKEQTKQAMSSLLLSLSSKPSLLRKLSLRCHSTIRMFSSTTSTNPYLMYRVTSSGKESAGAMTELRMFDPAKEDYFTVGDKPLPKELVSSALVGSSHGWGVFTYDGRSILVSDFCNPSSSKSNPKIIPLYPRPNIIGCQTEVVSGVAMTSSPQEQDCVICVKFAGRPVSIYTPGRDTDKGHLLLVSQQVFDHFEESKLMYSKRDQKFYMVSTGGHHLWSWGGIRSTIPQFIELRFHNLPQFSHSELQLLDSCYRTHDLVESSSGQRFLVKWYVRSPDLQTLWFDCSGTKRFMVFREEEDMVNMCYTEDIGDLCIFIGDNEPFCVEASSFPGLIPNSIYFAGDGYGEGYGVYDIASRTPRSFEPKSLPGFPHLPNPRPCWVPHWLPPVPLQ